MSAREAASVNWIEELQYFLIQTARKTSSKASLAKIYFLNGSTLTLKSIVVGVMEECLGSGGASSAALLGHDFES